MVSLLYPDLLLTTADILPMDSRQGKTILSAGCVLDKKMVNEVKYQTKRYLWVDFSSPELPLLCWSKGNTKNEKKFKSLDLAQATAYLVGMPLKVSAREITAHQMDGSKCLCIVHAGKGLKGGVDLRFPDRNSRDLWYTTLNGASESPVNLSLNKMLIANVTVEVPANAPSLSTVFVGGETIETSSHSLRPFSNICVGEFSGEDAYGLKCGFCIDDIIVAMNGKEMLGQNLNVLQECFIQCKAKSEAVRFSLYRDSKSNKPLILCNTKSKASTVAAQQSLPLDFGLLKIDQEVTPNVTVEIPHNESGGFQTIFCGGDPYPDASDGTRNFLNVYVEGFKEKVQNPHGKIHGLRIGDIVAAVNDTNVLGEDFDVFYDVLSSIIHNKELAVLKIYRMHNEDEVAQNNDASSTPVTTGLSHADVNNAPDDNNADIPIDQAIRNVEHVAHLQPNHKIQCKIPNAGFNTIFEGGDAVDGLSSDSQSLMFQHIVVGGFVDDLSDGQIPFGKQIGFEANDVIISINDETIQGKGFDNFKDILSNIINNPKEHIDVKFEIYRESLQESNPTESLVDTPIQQSLAEKSNTIVDGNISTIVCPNNPNGGSLGVIFSGGEYADENTGHYNPIIVEEFLDDSFGQACGLKLDDHIMTVGNESINGKPLHDFQDKVKLEMQKGRGVTFEVRRKYKDEQSQNQISSTFADEDVSTPQQQLDEEKHANEDVHVSTGVLQTSKQSCDQAKLDELPTEIEETRQIENNSLGPPSANFHNDDHSNIEPPPGAIDSVDNTTNESSIAAPSKIAPSFEEDHTEGEGEGWIKSDTIGFSNMDNFNNSNRDEISLADDRRTSASTMMDMDTQQWLQSLNLGKFIPAFADADIYTIEDISNNLDRCDEIGLNKVQQRRLKHMLGQYRNDVYTNLETVALMNSGVLKSQKKWKSLLNKPTVNELRQDNQEKAAFEQIVRHHDTAENEASEQNMQNNGTTELKKTIANEPRQDDQEKLAFGQSFRHHGTAENAENAQAIDMESCKTDPTDSPVPSQSPSPKNVFKRSSINLLVSPQHLLRDGPNNNVVSGPDKPLSLSSADTSTHSIYADNAHRYPYGLHHPNLPPNKLNLNPMPQHTVPSNNARRAVTVSALSPYIRAEQYQAMYAKLRVAKEKLCVAKNIHVLLRAVTFERMVADNNVDNAILQEHLLNGRLKCATMKSENAALQKR